MPPRFIYFDAAFTLIEPHPSVGSVYARVAGAHGLRASADALDNAFLPAYRVVSKELGNIASTATEPEARTFWRAVVDRVFLDTGKTMPGGGFFDEVYDQFATSDCWRVFPDAEAAIQRARSAGIGVGILSNFDHRLHPLLTAIGLRDKVEHVVVSCDLNVAKPDRRIFDHAAALTGLDTAALAMIGDSPREDIEGALAAGWSACRIDRTGIAQGGAHPARRSLVECVEWLLA